MKQEVISAKLTDRQAKLVKEIIENFKERNKKTKISGPKFGKIADAILMSLKIDENHYIDFIKTMLGNDINILFTKNTNPKTKKIVEEFEEKRKEAEIRKKLRKAEENRSVDKPVVDQQQNTDKLITIKQVEKLVEQGKYQEVLRISKSINCIPKVVTFASESIGEAARNLIEELRFDGLSNKNKINDAITKLILVAADKSLRVTNDISILKEAGQAAIELAASNYETVDELIKICNNNALHHSVTIESAVKFAELVFADPDYYKDELDIAVRSLSVRWMNIAFDVARRDMNEEELEKYEQLIDHIENKR